MRHGHLTPIHPGEILREEFLAPLGMSSHALALALRVPATRINDVAEDRLGKAVRREVVAQKRGVTEESGFAETSTAPAFPPLLHGEGCVAIFLRDAVDKAQAPLRERRGAGAGKDDAAEVERVGGGNLERFSGRLGAAEVAQEVEGFGAGELFADESGDEAAATDFAASFHAAVDQEQLAPGGREALAGQEIAEHDAPAVEQLLGEKFGLRAVARSSEQGPASGGVARTSVAASAFALAAFRVDQGAQVFETVGGDDAGGGELPQAIFDLAREAAGVANDFIEEESSAGFESGEDVASLMRE